MISGDSCCRYHLIRKSVWVWTRVRAFLPVRIYRKKEREKHPQTHIDNLSKSISIIITFQITRFGCHNNVRIVVFIELLNRWLSSQPNYIANGITYFICTWTQSHCRHFEQFESKMVRRCDFLWNKAYCWGWNSTCCLQWMVTSSGRYGNNATIWLKHTWDWILGWL